MFESLVVIALAVACTLQCLRRMFLIVAVEESRTPHEPGSKGFRAASRAAILDVLAWVVLTTAVWWFVPTAISILRNLNLSQ